MIKSHSINNKSIQKYIIIINMKNNNSKVYSSGIEN